jgi:inactivated superfamily I helicase
MDEIETEGSDWSQLADLATGELAGWWQVTLDFLAIVTGALAGFAGRRSAASRIRPRIAAR